MPLHIPLHRLLMVLTLLCCRAYDVTFLNTYLQKHDNSKGKDQPPIVPSLATAIAPHKVYSRPFGMSDKDRQNNQISQAMKLLLAA